MKKKILFSFVAGAITLMPIKAQAQEAYAALSNDNTTLTFYYDNEKSWRNGMDIGPFTDKKERGWYENVSNITTVVFDNSFANKEDLISTAHWLHSMRQLTTIIGIENLKTDNVTDMSSMFDDCRSLTSINLNHFNTEKVESMRSMFEQCVGIISFDLGSFNTKSVKDMGSMFYGCESLESINLSNFNTDNVIEMGGMFENCKMIQSIDVSSFNTSNVESMGYMFSDCDLLREVDLCSFNTSNVTYMRNLFAGDGMLTTIYVSEEWTTDLIDEENGKRMFSNCSNLVGGSGTKWDENHIDYSYAHIDGGASNPGYLTYKEKGNTSIEYSKATDNVETDYYNLNGIKLQRTPAKGTYIRNGKKYLMK